MADVYPTTDDSDFPDNVLGAIVNVAAFASSEEAFRAAVAQTCTERDMALTSLEDVCEATRDDLEPELLEALDANEHAPAFGVFHCYETAEN